MLYLVAQSCLTLCDPVNHSPPGSSVQGDSPGKNTEVGCHVLLQGICPTEGRNPGLPHCRRLLYQLNHQGSHMYTFFSLNSHKTLCNFLLLNTCYRGEHRGSMKLTYEQSLRAIGSSLIFQIYF